MDSDRNHDERGLSEARYANYFQAGFNTDEVIIDFGQFHSGEAQPHFHTRIITSPYYARSLLQVLQRTLAEHEDSLGPPSRR